MIETIELAARLVNLLIDAVGIEKARELVSEETRKRAFAEADAAAVARQIAEGL